MQVSPNIHPLIQANLGKFKGRFEAWEYDSEKMQLFCAYYPENTQIEPHTKLIIAEL
jgi:hypothetical protein